LGVRC
jgi:hypothetical protein